VWERNWRSMERSTCRASVWRGSQLLAEFMVLVQLCTVSCYWALSTGRHIRWHVCWHAHDETGVEVHMTIS
jgi:hypothetical protein